MESRREHRIVYQTRIRLRATGREDSVVARVQNLSPRGMFVTGAEVPEAGTEVQCRLTLAGQRRTVKGRVAWVRPASAVGTHKGAGAGIEFIDLEEPVAKLIGRLIEPVSERQPVEVWFEGLKAPVRCQAALVGEGVRLSTRLPFMRLDSKVRVSFGPADGRKPREGVLDAITMDPSDEDGVPNLQLNVSLQPEDSARGTIEIDLPRPAQAVVEPDPIEASTVIDPTVSSPPPTVVTAGPSLAGDDRTVKVAMPLPPDVRHAVRVWLREFSRQLSRGWQVAAVGFAAGAVLVSFTYWLARPSADSLTEAAAHDASQYPQYPRTGAEDGSFAGKTADSTARTGKTAGVAAVAADRAGKTAGSASPGGAAVEEAKGTVAAGSASDGSRSESDQPGPDTLEVQREGTTLRLRLPIRGSSGGAQQFPLAKPNGIAITLPNGRPVLAPGVYRPSNHLVRVQVRRRPTGSQLRFFYNPKRQAKIGLDGDAITFELTPRR